MSIHVRASAATGGAWGTSSAVSGASIGSHSSHVGRYQFHSPSSFIAAGSRTARMTVASITTATARPKRVCLASIVEIVANRPKTATMISAALVTVPAVCVIAWRTAFSVDSPRPLPPRIRLITRDPMRGERQSPSPSRARVRARGIYGRQTEFLAECHPGRGFHGDQGVAGGLPRRRLRSPQHRGRRGLGPGGASRARVRARASETADRGQGRYRGSSTTRSSARLRGTSCVPSRT
jgi:hypothetical protein